MHCKINAKWKWGCILLLPPSFFLGSAPYLKCSWYFPGLKSVSAQLWWQKCWWGIGAVGRQIKRRLVRAGLLTRSSFFFLHSTWLLRSVWVLFSYSLQTWTNLSSKRVLWMDCPACICQKRSGEKVQFPWQKDWKSFQVPQGKFEQRWSCQHFTGIFRSTVDNFVHPGNGAGI